jgi:hypothetical protein
MAFQIALVYSKACEKELKDMGFKKQTVYMKHAPGFTTKESKDLGDSEFFKMQNTPWQFVTTSYWGAGPD